MSRFTRYLSSLSLCVGTLLVPAAAFADYPAAQATPGQVWIFPGDTEFDWRVTGAEDGTTITVTYTGCGDQVAGASTQTAPGDYTFTVRTDPDKLGPDWTRTLTIEEPGFDPYTETVQNSDPNLAFTCGGEEAQPLVDTWSRKKGKVTHSPRVGQTVAVTPTVLTQHAEDDYTVVDYSWFAGQNDVSGQQKLTVKKAWVGKSIKMVVTVTDYSTEQVETTTLKYGSVPKMTRDIETVGNCSNCTTEADWLAAQGRIMGADGAGVFVFQQYRPCGGGTWKSFRRQTTTAHGNYDLGADTPKQRRKYQEKRLSKVPMYSAQSSTFIPGNGLYRPTRFVNSYCL